MKRICFVCLGNICRSPMAEFIMKDIVSKANKSEKYQISSLATSYEEEGNPLHRGASAQLRAKGIPFSERRATVATKADYDKYDLFVCMEDDNIRALYNRLGGDKDGKIIKLLDNADVADPYYTGNFALTYYDISLGCKNLFDKLERGEL